MRRVAVRYWPIALWLGCVVLLAQSSRAVALELHDDASDPRVRFQLAQPEAEWITARLRRGTSDSLHLLVDPGPALRIVLARDVGRLQKSEGLGRHPGRGALIGGVAAGGAGLALGIAISRGLGESDNAAGVAAFTAFSALGGVLVGALVGSLVRTEQWSDMPQPWDTGSMSSPPWRLGSVRPLRTRMRCSMRPLERRVLLKWTLQR